MTHPAICNGSQSRKERQRINGSVKVAKSVVPGGIHIPAKIRISLLAPTVPTSAAQEVVALPIQLVVISVMSPIPFVGSNPSRFFSVDGSVSICSQKELKKWIVDHTFSKGIKGLSMRQSKTKRLLRPLSSKSL